MEKVVFFNTKGGTGKTTICYNYGWYLAEKKDKKVLFMDFDPQTNLVQALGKASDESKANLDNLMIDYLKGKKINFEDYVIKITDNIDLLPSSNNISLVEEYLTDYLINKTFSEHKIYKALNRNMMIRDIFEENISENHYDYIVIDSQSNFSLLSTTSIIYARKVIVVIKPEWFSLLNIDYLFKIIKNLERKYNVEIKIVGIIVNAFEKRKKAPEYVVDTLQKKYGDRLTIFNQKIRYLVHYQKSISLKGEPVFISFPYAEASDDIIRLFSQVEKSVDSLG
ncbi:MAG: ParA family protein [Candidatus Hydromicrobium sp.]|nr:ParA family protein [Actinomycetota bacterium]